ESIWRRDARIVVVLHRPSFDRIARRSPFNDGADYFASRPAVLVDEPANLFYPIPYGNVAAGRGHASVFFGLAGHVVLSYYALHRSLTRQKLSKLQTDQPRLLSLDMRRWVVGINRPDGHRRC